MSIESMMPSNRLILYCTLYFLLSILPSQGLSENKVIVVGERPSMTSVLNNLQHSGAEGRLELMPWCFLLSVSHSVLSDCS